MLTATVQPDDGYVKWTVVIIIVVWLITTFRYGPGWLTPAEIGFFALILNPTIAQASIHQLSKEPDV